MPARPVTGSRKFERYARRSVYTAIVGAALEQWAKLSSKDIAIEAAALFQRAETLVIVTRAE
jgi:hypothetical protein